MMKVLPSGMDPAEYKALGVAIANTVTDGASMDHV